MNTFGISSTGYGSPGVNHWRLYRLQECFPQQKAHVCRSPEAKSKSEELADEPTANIVRLFTGYAKHHRQDRGPSQ